MDGEGREGYSDGTMTNGSIRESVTGCRVATSGETNTTWRVYDGNGGSLPSSVLGNRYLFQGREYSWAVHAATGGTGLYYFRARYYAPFTGRWLSNDPIGISGGLNQYAFCANNPVMFGDPEGLNIEIRGSADFVKRVEQALERLKTTAIGARMIAIANAPGNRLVIIGVTDDPTAGHSTTHQGGSVDGKIILYDSDPLGIGPDHDVRNYPDEMPESLETVIGHDMGHAVLGCEDPENVIFIEHSIRKELGEKPRRAYHGEPL